MTAAWTIIISHFYWNKGAVISKWKNWIEKENYYSLITALANRLAKLEKINKEYSENKIYVSYLLPYKKKNLEES